MRKEQILCEIVRIVNAKDYTPVTHKELATRLGLTPPAIRHYFPTAESLHGAVRGACRDLPHTI